jgi:uncharacterized protein
MSLFNRANASAGPADSSPVQSSGGLNQLAVDLYFQSDHGRQIERGAMLSKAAAAARPIGWIAGLKTFAVLLAYAILHQRMAEGDHQATQAFWAACAMAAAFWGLLIWARLSPLPAAIIGLLLYTTELWQVDALHPRLAHGLLIPAARASILFILARAIYNGVIYRQTEGADGAAIQAGTQKPWIISSAILLYLTLLSIVVTPLFMAATSGITFDDQLNIHKLMAIVIVVWSAIAWRDVLPALRNVGRPSWISIALICAVAVRIFGVGYMAAMRRILGIEPMPASTEFLAHAWTWSGIIAITAVFPAVFEELAFRGVIVPCLLRALTEKETMAVSAIMFMILHLSVFSAPHLLILGLMLGFIRLKSGSIWPCVLLHFTYNSLCVLGEKM